MPLSPQQFDELNVQLAWAVLYTNQEYRMGVHDLREALQGRLPDADKLVMDYDLGGQIEVFTIGDQSVRLPTGATAEDLLVAFKKKVMVSADSSGLQASQTLPSLSARQ